VTTAIVIAALGLQLWAIIRFWPHRQNALAIALAVASSGLAVRGVTILFAGNTATITEEALLAVVSAA